MLSSRSRSQWWFRYSDESFLSSELHCCSESSELLNFLLPNFYLVWLYIYTSPFSRVVSKIWKLSSAWLMKWGIRSSVFDHPASCETLTDSAFLLPDWLLHWRNEFWLFPDENVFTKAGLVWTTSIFFFGCVDLWVTKILSEYTVLKLMIATKTLRSLTVSVTFPFSHFKRWI